MPPRAKTPRTSTPVENLGQLSWDDLGVIEALDRLGSPGRAARELGVSVSKVYRRVAELERALGAPCVERGVAGKLTETGRSMAQIARQTAASLAMVRQALRLGTEQLAGEVSLTTVEGFIPLIAPALAALSARAPQLSIALDVGFHGPSLRRREVDVALAVMHDPPEGLWGRRVMTIRYGVFGTPALRAAASPPWIVLGRPLLTTPQAAWERIHARPVALRCATLSTQIAFAKAGVGLCVVPTRLAALHPELSPLDGYDLSSLDRPAWLLTHPDLRDTPRVRAVLDTLLAALA